MQDLLPRVVDVDRDDVHARRHDFRGGYIREIDRRADKFRSILVQDIFVLGDIDHRVQLLQSRVTVCIFNIRQEVGDQIDQTDHDKGDRLEDDHQRPDGIREGKREPRGVLLGCDLGNGLAKDDDCHCYSRCRYPGVLLSQRQHDRDRSHGGRGDVDQVVAYENGGQCVVEFVGDPDRKSCLFISVVALVLKPHFIACGIGHLRCGEKGREHDADNDPYDVNGNTHLRVTSSPGVRIAFA